MTRTRNFGFVATQFDTGTVSATEFAAPTGSFSTKVSTNAINIGGAVSGVSGVFTGTVSANELDAPTGSFSTLVSSTNIRIDGVASVSSAVFTATVSAANIFATGVALGTTALLGKKINVSGAALATLVSLTDGVSIAVNFNTSQNFIVQLGGNRTLETPSNCVAGQTGSLFIIQDGTGGRTLSYSSVWKWPGGTAPTLTTTSAAIDRIDYIVYTSTAIHAVATLNVK